MFSFCSLWSPFGILTEPARQREDRLEGFSLDLSLAPLLILGINSGRWMVVPILNQLFVQLFRRRPALPAIMLGVLVDVVILFGYQDSDDHGQGSNRGY